MPLKMTEARCPHCQTVLPEQATFCAACGNRIAGWSQVPVGDKPESLPGGQEPTTNMQPTPSLLRAAALSKKPKTTGPVDTDSALMRTVKRPAIWPLFIAVALAAGGLAYFLASRKPAPPPPVAAVAPPPSPVAAVAAVTAVAPPPVAKKRVRAHRAEPVQVATKAKPDRGGLPHKQVTTDSKPLEATRPVKVDPEATSAALTGDAVEPRSGRTVEETLSEEDQKKQAEASIDADGVRFVVKSHLSQ